MYYNSLRHTLRERPFYKHAGGGGVFPWTGIFFSQHTGAEKFFSGVYIWSQFFFSQILQLSLSDKWARLFFYSGVGTSFFFFGFILGREIFFKKIPPPPAYLMVAPLAASVSVCFSVSGSYQGTVHKFSRGGGRQTAPRSKKKNVDHPYS